MNNYDFQQHFINTLKRLDVHHYEDAKYTVLPAEGEKVSPNGKNDLMRLFLLPRKRTCSFAETVKLFTWCEGYYPRWIRASVADGKVLLQASMQMEKAGKNDDKALYPFQIKEKEPRA